MRGKASMPSPTEGDPRERALPPRDGAVTARCFALCLLLSAALQIMENMLPRLPLFPWLKLGLSHLILLPFLLRFGPGPAGALLLGRNLLTLLFAAGALSTFLIGTVSGLAAMMAGGWLARGAVSRGILGMTGAGMLMAALMNLSQLAVVEGLFIRHMAFFFQLAPMLAWSAVSGAAIAYLAHRSRPVLEGIFSEGDGPGEESPGRVQGGGLAGPVPDLTGLVPPGGTRKGTAAFLLWLAVIAALFLVPSLHFQAAAMAGLLAFSAWRGMLGKGLINLARSWPWFLYLAWLHLLLGDGEYLWGSWVTRPGAEAFLFYGARLGALVLLGPHLALSFPGHWLAGSVSPYVRGLVAALPLLPGLHGAAVGAGKAFFRALRGGGEAGVLRGLADGFRAELARPKPQ